MSVKLTEREARALLDNLDHAKASVLPDAEWHVYVEAKRKLSSVARLVAA